MGNNFDWGLETRVQSWYNEVKDCLPATSVPSAVTEQPEPLVITRKWYGQKPNLLVVESFTTRTEVHRPQISLTGRLWCAIIILRATGGVNPFTKLVLQAQLALMEARMDSAFNK